MTKRIDILAPAKINFHLDIQGIRPDGFHELRSIFQLISLYDEISVTCTDQTDFSCLLLDKWDHPQERNTMYRAAELFFRETALSAAVEISCTKHIPSQAGLGGGSSDAAAVLRALNSLYGNPLTVDDLVGLGSRIGSDVPFFIDSTAALVYGRGDIVETIPPRGDIYGVVVCPDYQISTPSAYRSLDAYREMESSGPSRSLDGDELLSIYNSPVRRWSFHNSFSEILYRDHPDYAYIEMLLKSSGAEFVSLSGSGSAVFGISEDSRLRWDSLIKDARLANMQVFEIKVLAVRPNAVYNY